MSLRIGDAASHHGFGVEQNRRIGDTLLCLKVQEETLPPRLQRDRVRIGVTPRAHFDMVIARRDGFEAEPPVRLRAAAVARLFPSHGP